MARVIKYRIYDKANFVWIQNINIFDCYERNGRYFYHYGVVPADASDSREEFDYDVEVEISQFTGLSDNKGTEVYEGDIVEINYSSGHERDSSYDIQGDFEIIFKNGGWTAKGKNLWGQEDEEFSLWTQLGEYAKKKGTICEVVGNIYE